MGKPLVKLMQGVRVLDLNDQARYWLSQDFTPPETAITPIFAGDAGDVFDQIESNRSFSFTVAITGSSSGQIDNALRAIKTMLNQAGKQREPLYLLYNASDTVPDLLWGQFGATLRYEVAHGEVSLADGYMVGVRRSTDINARITLAIKPYALGKQQRLCSATGAIIEDSIGTLDVRSRGLIVPGVNANLIPNPSFEHSTYLTGWTLYSAATTIEAKETSIVADGDAAYRVTNKSTLDAAGRYADISGLTPGATYTFSSWVYVISGRAQLYCFDGAGYSNGVVSSALSTQGQWTRVQVSKVCPAGGSIRVFLYLPANAATYKNCAIYDAVMLENSVAATPYRAGDKLGCAWSGTAHNSSTTCTAASVKLPLANNFNRACGAIRVVYKFALGTAALATQRLFTLDNTGNFLAQYQSTTQILLQDGSGSTVTGTITAPVAGQIDVLHFVYGDAGMTIYRNGVAINTTTAYIAPSDGTYIYIGSSDSATSQGNGTFMDFEIFDVDLTAAQVAADYANAAAVVADGARLGSIPWLWTKDGDDVVDNCNDATRDNWCVAGGVPGTAKAQTEVRLSGAWGSLLPYLTIGCTPLDSLISPTGILTHEFDGTADANSSNGEYKATAVTTGSTIGDSAVLPYDLLAGKEFYLVTRLRTDAAARLKFFLMGPNGAYYSNNYVPFAYLSQWYVADIGEITIPNDLALQADLSGSSLYIRLNAKSESGTANISLDYLLLLSDPIRIELGGSIAATSNLIVLKDGKAAVYTTDLKFDSYLKLSGNRSLDLEPGKYNVLVSILGGVSAATVVITSTMTYVLYVTPRWSLL